MQKLNRPTSPTELGSIRKGKQKILKRCQQKTSINDISAIFLQNDQTFMTRNIHRDHKLQKLEKNACMGPISKYYLGWDFANKHHTRFKDQSFEKSHQHSSKSKDHSNSTDKNEENIRKAKQKLKHYLDWKKQSKEKFKKQKEKLSKILSLNRNYQTGITSISLDRTPLNELQTNRELIKNREINLSRDRNEQIRQIEQINEELTKILSAPREQFRIKKCDKQEEKYEDDVNISENINQELRRQVLKNSQYLINPDFGKVKAISKQLKIISRTPNHIDFSSQSQKTPDLPSLSRSPHTQQEASTRKQSKKKHKPIQALHFKMDKLKMLASQLQKKTRIQSPPHHKNTGQQQKLLSQIKKGKYFKLDIQLSTNPQLLQTKQQKTLNNLLHLCIIHNQVDIFQLVLQKCREYSVNLFKQTNKYGKTPLQTAREFPYFYEVCCAKTNCGVFGEW